MHGSSSAGDSGHRALGPLGRSLPPVLTIRSGDTVTVETLSGEPADLPDPSLGFSVLPEHREVLASGYSGPGPHFLTGPIRSRAPSPATCSKCAFSSIRFRSELGLEPAGPAARDVARGFSRTPPHPHSARSRDEIGADAVGPGTGTRAVLRQFRRGSAAALGPACPRRSRAPSAATWTTRSSASAHGVFPGLRRRRAVLGRRRPCAQGDGEVCLTAIETALTGTFEFIVRTRHEACATARGKARGLDHDGLRRGSRRRREAGAPRHDRADQASSAACRRRTPTRCARLRPICASPRRSTATRASIACWPKRSCRRGADPQA